MRDDSSDEYGVMGERAGTPAPLLVRMVDWYQRAAEGRPSPCRFTPSCSSYAREALEVHGRRRGLWLTIRRLVRCRPFGPSGFDPVPLANDPHAPVSPPPPSHEGPMSQ